MKISVIIITLNEVNALERSVTAARVAAQWDSGRSVPIEIIVSDGGSVDGTLELAQQIADTIIQSPRGRFRQLNAGANASTGDILLFLHADTILPPHAILRICHVMRDPMILGGGFTKIWQWNTLRKLPRLLALAIYLWEGFGNWTVTLIKTFPGDNAIFIRKQIFELMGGYAPLWICEDLDFIRRLSRVAKRVIKQLPSRANSSSPVVCINTPVWTSARRFEQFGFLRTLAAWVATYFWWRLQMPPARLIRSYERFFTTLHASRTKRSAG